MQKYISILRGINVSGQKVIKMTDLRSMFEKLNFSQVQTYIQSGNILFSSDMHDEQDLAQHISSQIEYQFGFLVPGIVIEAHTFNTIVHNNPFGHDKSKDPSAIYLTFLSQNADPLDYPAIIAKKQAEEEIIFTSDVIYFYCPHSYGKTRISNNFIEKKLKVTATTRNWKTVLALQQLINAQ